MAKARDLKQFLGSVRAKITSNISERDQLVKHLSALIADANRLLRELGGARGSHRGHRVAGGAGSAGGRAAAVGRKRRRLSAAARDKIRQAQLRRWAKFRAAAK